MDIEVLDLLDQIMAEHYPQWVFENVQDRVICSCNVRVSYSKHIKELLLERVAVKTKDGKSENV